MEERVNSLLNNSKIFADNKVKVTQKVIPVFQRVENIVKKGESTGLIPALSSFPTMLFVHSKSYYKLRLCCKELISTLLSFGTLNLVYKNLNWLVGCIGGSNATLTAKVISWRSVTYMCFLTFSHQYQHNFPFQSHQLLFSHVSAGVRGENTTERKVVSTGN